MTIATSISKRERRRVLKSGIVVLHTRYVLNFRDPRTGKRRQMFCRSQKEAIAKRDNLVAAVATDTYAWSGTPLTVAGAIEHWLDNRRTEIKTSTWSTYRLISTNLIIGPLLVGTPAERKCYREKGIQPEGSRFLDMLGPTRIVDLTTGGIRRWHRTLTAEVGSRSANMAKTLLRAALALAAEDYAVRPPPMPTRLGRGRAKTKRALLTPQEVGALLHASKSDPRRIFYCWPFLMGTRPSEQLAIFWEDVDLDRNIVHIRRMLERSGHITLLTKTPAGDRKIPIGAFMRNMLMEWRLICPRDRGELKLVFPNSQGRPLSYFNYRTRSFKPALIKAGVRYVAPHSGRHFFISMLQAVGTEVGVVARLAGHATPSVTLNFYTAATRDGAAAIAGFERALLDVGRD